MTVPQIDHPARYSLVDEANITRHVNEYLTLTDHNLITRPYLLEAWEVSDDLRIWTLMLRTGIQFNNGDELTADDVIFTMNEWLNPDVGSSMLGLLTYLRPSNIEKVNNYVLRLYMDSPQIAVPEHLFHYPAQILHRGFDGNIVRDPIGTGPYLLDTFSAGDQAILTRRDDYWQAGADGQRLPYLDAIHYYHPSGDPSEAIRRGQIDHIHAPDVNVWQELRSDDSVQIVSVPTAKVRVLRMRVDREPWTDNRVRQALKACLDRQKIVDLAHHGEAVAGQDTHVAQIQPDYGAVETPTYDPAMARQLLAEAGYANGLDITLTYSSDWPDVGAFASIIREDAAPAGFRVELDDVPQSSYWDQWTEANLGITPWIGRPLATMVLSLAYIAGSDGKPVPWNESRWVDEEFSNLLRQAEGTLDIDERRVIMAELETIQQERGSVGIAYWQNAWDITSRRFQNVPGHPMDYDLWNEVWYSPEA